MPKTTTSKAMGILPGDTLTLEVPNIAPRAYALPAGVRVCKVLFRLAARYGALRYQVTDCKSKRRVNVWIPAYHCLSGNYESVSKVVLNGELLFINKDNWPVQFTHTPNLLTRLQQSVKPKRKGAK